MKSDDANKKETPKSNFGGVDDMAMLLKNLLNSPKSNTSNSSPQSPYVFTGSYKPPVVASGTGGTPTGYVSSPYIPLLVTSDIEETIPDETMFVTVPIWLGEVRDGGFHELVANAFRNTLNPTLKTVIYKTLTDFSIFHKDKPFTITLTGDGPHADTITDCPCLFRSIHVDELESGTMNSEWTTPLRMRFSMDKSLDIWRNRMVYGGHFYITGCADCENESEVSNIELHSIFWEDYRNKKGPMKILDNV